MLPKSRQFLLYVREDAKIQSKLLFFTVLSCLLEKPSQDFQIQTVLLPYPRSTHQCSPWQLSLQGGTRKLVSEYPKKHIDSLPFSSATIQNCNRNYKRSFLHVKNKTAMQPNISCFFFRCFQGTNFRIFRMFFAMTDTALQRNNSITTYETVFCKSFDKR